MLTITVPAPDPTLLTLAEIADAVGQPIDTPGLSALNDRVSDLIAAECGLERAGASRLTLREETLTETLRLPYGFDVLYLSRKPVLEILSLTENGEALAEDYGYEQRDGRSLYRLAEDAGVTCWAAGKIVISYRAGWATVPPALKELAAKLAVVLWSERGRDPSLGSRDIPGVISESYRYGRPDDPLIPNEICEGLRAGGFVMQEMVF